MTTGDKESNDVIREWCRRSSIQCVTGPEENLVERHLRTLSTTGSDILVRITGDCPFVPPSEIDWMIEECRQRDVALVTDNSGEMPVGSAVDVLGRQTLEELSDHGKIRLMSPLDKKASSWDVCITDAAKWTQLGAAHTAVDTPADYWRLIDAVEAVGENPYTVSSWLAQNQKP